MESQETGTSTARWPRLVLGLVAIAAGVWLMLKPFTSLGALTILIAVSQLGRRRSR